ncbi:hypothetical protein F4604DRAFT_1921570 [Suillus subluteus]|nr:hypothetical protein F4604DRAFT_1921570 [Suillus subluteus]
MSIGRICEILVSHNIHKTVDHVALQVFSFGPTLHPSIFLPCLNLAKDEIVSMAADIICTINLQHNCIDSKCVDMRQQHPTPHYFLNTYSIHNCDHIQLVIPEVLSVQQMKDKKAVKKLGDTPGPQEGATTMEEGVCNATAPLPAFDRTPTKRVPALSDL